METSSLSPTEGSQAQTGASPRVLEVFDPQHQPHLVMTLRLLDDALDVEPSEAAKAHIEEDLRSSHEEARHLPVIGWLIEKAVLFAEHRMADYFGVHDLRKVQMRFDGARLFLHVGRANLVLGPGEIDAAATQAFVAEFERLKHH
jgi:hypothetical protein